MTTTELYNFSKQFSVDDHVIHNSGKMKSVCVSAVLGYLGIGKDTYKYTERANTYTNLMRRRGFAVRSRMSKIKKGGTVGGSRKTLAKMEGDLFVVEVRGHLLLLNGEGETIVDTSPRSRDSRKIVRIYSVFKKGA